MNKYPLIIFLAAFFLLLSASCSKPITDTSENNNRTQPVQPEGFNLDTTWDEGITIPF